MSRDRWQNEQDRKSGQAGEPGERRPLDVDDDQMWSAARRPPLSADALKRIAVRAKMSSQPRFPAARWRVWAAASLLLLIGGAAGAAVATFVIKRPVTGSLTDAEGKRARAWTQPPRNRTRAEAPAQTPPAAPVTETGTPTPQAPAVPAPPAVIATGSTKKASGAQKHAAPVQLAMRGPAISAPTAPMAQTPPPPRGVSATATSMPTSPPPPPTVAPQMPSPGPVPTPSLPTGAGAEARILRSALTAAHRQDDPAAALALLDQYDALFPRGTLRAEATLARAYSLRRLGRDDELLRLLERMSFAGMPRAAELRVLRGELLMTGGRFADATKDFEATLASGASDGLVERALFGRASCRSHLGDPQGARADLTRYLERFPASPRADEVRATLAH